VLYYGHKGKRLRFLEIKICYSLGGIHYVN